MHANPGLAASLINALDLTATDRAAYEKRLGASPGAADLDALLAELLTATDDGLQDLDGLLDPDFDDL